MLIQTLLLQDAINKWIDDYDSSKLKLLKLSNVKWKHIEYLITLLYSFYRYIKTLSTTSGCTVHQVWQIYNNLFQHLENQYKEAEYEIEWKKSLTTAIEVAKKKFSIYYEQTKHVREEFYAIATILNSYIWMNTYNSKH